MLKNCPECSLMISDKANFCPHCGFILNDFFQKSPPRKNTVKKYRRLPNGFGQITEIKNRNLRNPFRVMITTGKTENGRPISKPLQPKAYFATYNEAYEALVEYNKHPYELSSDMTMAQLYEEWYNQYSKNIKSVSSRNAVQSAWAYCAPIYEYRVVAVRPRIVRGLIENATRDMNGEERKASARVKLNMKTLLTRMFSYAVECELIEENFIRNLELDADIIRENKEVKKEHIAFEPFETARLWANVERSETAAMIIMQTYTGFRPKELLDIKLSDIDLDKRTITGGIKTQAGKNRIVPIHPRISEIVFKQYKFCKDFGFEYLWPSSKNKDMPMPYKTYSGHFTTICKELGLNREHLPHDPRKTFITRAKEVKMDEYAIKRIVGHKISDVTEAIYTDRSIDWLHEEIKKIK